MDLLIPLENADLRDDTQWFSDHWDANADLFYMHATSTVFKWKSLCTWLADNPNRRRASELLAALGNRPWDDEWSSDGTSSESDDEENTASGLASGSGM